MVDWNHPLHIGRAERWVAFPHFLSHCHREHHWIHSIAEALASGRLGVPFLEIVVVGVCWVVCRGGVEIPFPFPVVGWYSSMREPHNHCSHLRRRSLEKRLLCCIPPRSVDSRRSAEPGESHNRNHTLESREASQAVLGCGAWVGVAGAGERR